MLRYLSFELIFNKELTELIVQIIAEEEDSHKDGNETMKLKREGLTADGLWIEQSMTNCVLYSDMSLFGICPAWDLFYLVVCEYCQQVIKPQALQKHIGMS